MSPARTIPQPVIAVGQVWADNDPRAEGRTLRIVSIIREGTTVRDGSPGIHVVPVGYARCRVLTDRRGAVKTQVGRTVHVNLERLRATRSGYRLLEEEPAR